MILIKSFEKDSKHYYHLTFNDNINSKEAILELIYEEDNTETIFPRVTNSSEGYWKMAISIKDVDIARANLIKQDIKVSDAIQVPNVAYLCHFNDPDGYCLELIQHTFKENHKKEKEDINYKLGNKAVFSLVTYRVNDINKSLDFYINELELKLYSKMDVSFRGFELYFLAPNIEMPPNEENRESIDNIEWMWQRQYTFIELQYVLDKKDLKYKVGKETGFNKISFISDKKEKLLDPDGYIIEKSRPFQPDNNIHISRSNINI
jgi:catechol 2,3-dioxygenase-like lactoylglutathione lyase family enzyme